ncbi:protein serine/threonine kinase, putative [Entamoeba dispar SAW760]|uniref:Protein serine/threonine kinase, putative n=1 Tax=Entamoeba dispar (strain ATCC PRA-260 / SAW760) TaxID=370354 RepID=B0EIT0_ENTDS|nr:protein serine/threonine kinase, putative [Entamoeba dispar SAW760]EDR25578.1 protein serine/threonine kinase, putative [Entamoeba dispar SAW760]|eukprot:EDR25578.1 protein serine/threonine kinase, putative [Entamoeba dispar SAW760]
MFLELVSILIVTSWSCAIGEYFFYFSCYGCPNGYFCPGDDYDYSCNCNSCNNINGICYSSCSTGYVKDEIGRCQKCAPGYYRSSERICSKCDNGYYCPGDGFQYKANCYRFNKQTGVCNSNCYLGYVKSADGKCQECSSSYFMNEGSCLSCNCDSCNSTTGVCFSKCDSQTSYSNGFCSYCNPGNYYKKIYSYSCYSCKKSLYCPGNDNAYYCNCRNCDSTTGNCKSYCYAGYEKESSTGRCIPCQEGYYSIGDGEQCKKCGCSICDKKQGCSIGCDPGYSYDSNKRQCTICSSGSYSIGGKGSCLSCEGNTISSVEGSSLCEPCPTNQVANLQKTVCEYCVEGKYFSNGVCLPCPDGKIKEDRTTSYCHSCERNEISNSDHTQCLQCEAGKYKNGNSCSYCGPNQYSLKGAISCLSCDSSCLSCDPTNGYCLTCNKGSYLNTQTNKCELCPAGTYSSITTANSCNKCLEQEWSPSGSITCFPCNENCQECDNTNGRCRSCPKGYGYDAKNGICTICKIGTYSSGGINGCYVCNVGSVQPQMGQSSCEPCGDGFYQDAKESSTCKPCSSSCSSCSKTTGACLSCKEGYGLSNGVCSECPPGTHNPVTNTGMCISCESGTYSNLPQQQNCIECPQLYWSNPNSISCKVCDESCKSCDKTNGKCLTCKPGYGINLKDGTCTACGYGNYSNGETSVCQICEDGYYTNQIKQEVCQPCSSSCSECDKLSGECIHCKAGHQLENGICKTCQEMTYSLLNQDKCTSCDSSCKQCSSVTGKCTSCPNGEKTVSGVCRSCAINGHCVLCSLETNEEERQCKQCSDGYYFKSNNCYECNKLDPNCLACNPSEEKCISCSGNTILNELGTKCVPCKDGEVKISETQCVPCSSKIEGCSSCIFNSISNIKCASCYAPYELTNEQTSCINCLTQLNSYYDQDTKRCITNNQGCLDQVRKTECINCDSNNYYLRNGICSTFDSQCTKKTSKGCEECSNLIIPNNSQCNINIEHCKYGMSSTQDICYLCELNYQNNNGNCEQTTGKCQYYQNEYCLLCNEGISNGKQCVSCNKGVSVCIYYHNKEVPIRCSDGYFLGSNNECVEKTTTNCQIINNSYCIQCGPHQYINHGNCKNNNEECEIEDKNGCLKCNDGISINGECQSTTTLNCNKVNKNQCLECKDNNYRNINTCSPIDTLSTELKQCKTYNVITEKCLECSNEYLLYHNTKCQAKQEPQQNKIKKEGTIDNCFERTSKGCLRCKSGYYLEDGDCLECQGDCWECSSKDYCTGCDPYSYPSNGKCIKMNDLVQRCDQMMSTYTGCVNCKEGYYKAEDGKNCNKCDKSCLSCMKNNTCIQCAEDYFRYGLELSTLCLPQTQINNCLNKTKHGCEICEDGYYRTSVYQCKKCRVNCTSCSNENQCLSCITENVLGTNGNCLHYSFISNCINSSESKCSECSKGYRLDDEETGCVEKKKNIGMIIGITIGTFIIVLIIVITIIIIISLFYIQHKKEKKKMDNICVFEMKRSNIKMEELYDVICSNTNEINFNSDRDKIKVNEESRELVCIGNNGNNRIKVQFTTQDGNEKYNIRTEPKIITLKKGEACEFEIFIIPLCTCTIEDDITIVGLDIGTSKEIIAPMKIKFDTELTTRLDPDELIEEKKIGEGSFGIVYIGKFRGSKVAIKKMKEIAQTKTAIDEFEKEVAMLDKFRSEYIIHFYGAVMIPGKVCMVTEYAKYGSLQDMIDKRKETLIPMKMKIKFMIDAAKGIQYLHSNGILHRDIKPDNILVISIEENEQINCKLTDFGSARNVNLMMTNMTFTKGIGSPKYMAPEILNKEHYKMPSDIYSLAVSMYQTWSWKNPYDKDESSQFKYPWKIAEFVTSGKRLERVPTIPEKLYNVIEECWKQIPEERIKINNLVEILEQQYQNETN